MSKCTYKLNGQEFTYSELIEYISTNFKNQYNSISEILFSKNDKRDAIHNQINAVKKEFKIKKSSEINSYSNSDVEFESPHLSLNQFIDGPLCSINGRQIITPYNLEERIAQMKDKLQRDGYSNVDEEIEKILKNEENIIEDSFVLHSLLTSPLIRSQDVDNASYKFINQFQSVATERMSGNRKIAASLYTRLRNIIKSLGNNESKLVTNVNLLSKLNNSDKKLLGHIDYMYVDSDGTLHLYNFKVSSQDFKSWPSAKLEKYRLQMSLLKAMLAENGIPCKDATLHIIPVHVKYEDGKVYDIQVANPESISSKTRGNYALDNYDKQVKVFLNDNVIPNVITNEAINKANQNIEKIFPELSIRTDGFTKTAEQWIRTLPSEDPDEIEPICIKEVNKPGNRYNVIIRNISEGTTRTIEIKSEKHKHNNKELLEIIRQEVKNLDDHKEYYLKQIKQAINDAYIKKDIKVFNNSKIMRSSLSFFYDMFGTYFQKDSDDEFVWELVDSLSDANVLMFKHKKTKQIDVITISSFDLNTVPKFSRGDSVLGSYKERIEANVLKGDFGNIELIRTMTLLNEIIPTIQNAKLGTIKVINPQHSAQRSYSANFLSKKQFTPIIKVVNAENSKVSPIKNNFKNVIFADEVEILLDEYNRIISTISDASKIEYERLGFPLLQSAIGTVQQENALYNIIKQIYDYRPDFTDEESIIKAANGYGPNSPYAKLLILASQAYQAIRGEQTIHNTKLSSPDVLFHTALNVPDINIQIVAENLQVTNDTIAKEFIEQYSPIRKLFEEFYKAAGYTDFQNMTYGNQEMQYRNLYDPEKEFSFKNPYDMSNDLKDYERKLLKKILFAIYRINGGDQFRDENDSNINKYIQEHPHYLWVPMEKASKATQRQKLNAMKAFFKYTKNIVTNTKDRIEEVLNGLIPEEAELMESSSKYNRFLKNPFSLTMYLNGENFKEVEKRRKEYLKRGKDFYETNLENIFIDYLFKDIQTTQYNKYLLRTKSLLLSLQLTNYYGQNQDIVKKEVEHIKDYLKVNVYQRSIIEPTNQKIMSVLQPIKSVVTDMFLMGNVQAFFRDCIQGVLENYTRSIIKLNTDITPKTVTQAYAYVTTHATSNAMAQNLLSELCKIYRLSNTDVSRISERAKTGRNGALNLENWVYSTLRSPDFLNRMTLFVAKCMQDGCWEGWYLEDGDLKYNWKNDKRFNLLATKQIGHKDYNKQKSLYLSKLREYYQEHPEEWAKEHPGEELQVNIEMDLKVPYSNQDILSIRSLADNIYGSYDKSKKAMYENWALGVTFGMFTTWFNGIYNTYFSKPGSYKTSQLMEQQDTDDNGQLLYFDINGGITTEQYASDGTENQKVLKWVPIMSQGIIPTLITLQKIVRNNGMDVMKKYLKSNPQERANLKKLLNDLLMMLLYGVLFKLVLQEKYQDYKKTMKDNSAIQNATVEILYKGSYKAMDSFFGPINILTYFGEETNPATYSAPIQVITDLKSIVFDDRSFSTIVTNNTGLGRSFKDTTRALLSD